MSGIEPGGSPDSEDRRRFEFGANWQRFLKVLDESGVSEAQASMVRLLGMTDLTGSTFLDVGSGSGLHSLVARRLGATVHSFDYDEKSVACTEALKAKFCPRDSGWVVGQGSILDNEFVASLREQDIVYSWGVLHHTGNLWQALYNAHIPVRKGGLLAVAVYNDQGMVSCLWKIVKKTYCSGTLGRAVMIALFFPAFFLAGLLSDAVKLRNPFERFREHKKYRGMSLVHDWLDWLGGYPYEPARPENVSAFFNALGLDLVRIERTKHGFGNNEFLFRRK